MEITERRIQTISLVVLTVIVCGVVLHLLKIVFLPFVLAVFVSLGLSALVGLQVRYLRLPINLAVVSTLLLTLVLFWLAGLLIVTSVEQMISSASVYETQLNRLMQEGFRLLRVEHIGIDSAALTQPLQQLPIQTLIEDLGSNLLDMASMTTMVFLYVIYLLFLLPRQRQEPALWREITARVRAYLIAKTATSAALGLLIGLVLAFCEIQFAMLFGLLAFMLNFVPMAGPVIAALAPWPIILLSPDLGLVAMLISLFTPGTLFFVIGNFVEPKVLGRSVQLQPLAVLLALIFWGVLWGPLGVLLATPITGILTLLASYSPLTRPIARLVADRPQPG
ncbi:AI-2E family transporter [Halochromatium sp.]